MFRESEPGPGSLSPGPAGECQVHTSKRLLLGRVSEGLSVVIVLTVRNACWCSQTPKVNRTVHIRRDQH